MNIKTSLFAFATGCIYLCLQLPLSANVVMSGEPLPIMKKGDWNSLKLKWKSPEDPNNDFGCPIGNNFNGAKIKGGVATETLQLNDKTFWSGAPNETEDPRRRDALAKTRERLAAGDLPGADQAARGMWGPQDVGSYLPIGLLKINFSQGNTVTNYSRELDLDRALATIKYTADGVDYTRETFASFPDKVIVMRISSSVMGKLNFTAALKYPPQMEGHGGSVTADGDDTLVMQGRAPGNSGWNGPKGMSVESRLTIKIQSGTISVDGNALHIQNATSATLLFGDATSYNGYNKDPGADGVDPEPLVKEIMSNAVTKSYDQLFSRHVSDYQSLSRRLWVEINGETPNKYALGLQYSRYDMICCSRNGERPHNQQGMWNKDWPPSNWCAHYLNENVEKYYSLIEPANIADCGEPLWNWITELSIHGTHTAQVDWGFDGWVAPHYSDVWCSTTIHGGNNEWAIFPMGGIWLCQNLWEHYAFGMDKQFLSNRAYPVMKGAAEFALDLLVDDGKGHLVTSPSTSPENRFVFNGHDYAVSVGSTIDMSLIRQLFANCIQAEQILNVDHDLQIKLREASGKLLPYQINSKGELQEWSQADYTDHDPRHRHASHLISVWPLAQITEQGTPDFFTAAKVSLTNRGSGGYHPDKGAMWARLKDGDKALASNDSFPIDGALVGQWNPKYAGFAELLMQSHTDAIELLPALPSTWTSGKAIGLRARGGYELSLEWSKGELTRCQIDSPLGTTPVIRYKGEVINLQSDPRVTLNLCGKEN